MDREHILDALYRVIVDRRDAPTGTSYTASLMAKGVDKILKKIGEESTELVISGKGGTREEVICESADLVYHLLVLLAYRDINPEEVFAELRRRFGTSGLEEKASRVDI